MNETHKTSDGWINELKGKNNEKKICENGEKR